MRRKANNRHIGSAAMADYAKREASWSGMLMNVGDLSVGNYKKIVPEAPEVDTEAQDKEIARKVDIAVAEKLKSKGAEKVDTSLLPKEDTDTEAPANPLEQKQWEVSQNNWFEAYKSKLGPKSYPLTTGPSETPLYDSIKSGAKNTLNFVNTGLNQIFDFPATVADFGAHTVRFTAKASNEIDQFGTSNYFSDSWKATANGFDDSHISKAGGEQVEVLSQARDGIETMSEAIKTDPTMQEALLAYNEWSKRPDKRDDGNGMPEWDQVQSDLRPAFDKHYNTIKKYLEARDKFSPNMFNTGESFEKTAHKAGLLEGIGNFVDQLGNSITGIDENNSLAGNVRRSGNGASNAEAYPKGFTPLMQPDGKPVPNYALPSTEELFGKGPGYDMRATNGYLNAMNKINLQDMKAEEDIAWHMRQKKARGEASDAFIAKQNQNDNILFSMPSQVGISSGDVTTQFASTGLSMALGAASGVAKSPLIKGALTAVNFGSNLALNAYQRKHENWMELDENHRTKVNEYLAKNGGGDSNMLYNQSDDKILKPLLTDGAGGDIVNKARQELKANGALSPETRAIVERGILSRRIKTSDKVTNEALTNGDKQLKEYMKQNDAFMWTDVAEGLVMTFSYGKLGTKAFVLAAKPEASAAAKFAAKTIEMARGRYAKTIGKVLKSGAMIVPKIAAAHVVDALGESFEEAGQYVNGQNYVKNHMKEYDSYIGSLIEGTNSGISGVKMLLGENVDEKYYDKDKLQMNAKAGFYMGLLMPLPFTAIHATNAIKGKVNESRAKSYIDGGIGAILDSESRMTKANFYVNAATKGMSEVVVNHIEELGKNTPSPELRAQMQAEAKFAKEVLSVSNSPQVMQFAKKNGKYGSEDHKLLTSLIVDHNASYNDAVNAVTKSQNDFVVTGKADFESDFTFQSAFNQLNSRREDGSAAVIPEAVQRELHGILAEKQALEALINAKDISDAHDIDRKDKTVNSRQNKQFKTDLKSRLAAVNRKIDSFADIMDISKEDFNDLPSAKSSNESKASLSLGIVAQEGSKYDADVINALSGYESTRSANGEQSFKKMSEAKHSATVLEYLDKYRAARQSEDDTESNLQSQEDEKASKDDSKTVLEENGIPHPGTHEEPATELEATNTEEPLATVTPTVESTEGLSIEDRRNDIERRRSEDLEKRKRGARAIKGVPSETYKKIIASINDKYDAELALLDNEYFDSQETPQVQEDPIKEVLPEGDIENSSKATQESSDVATEPTPEVQEEPLAPTEPKGEQSVEAEEKATKETISTEKQAGRNTFAYASRMFYGVTANAVAPKSINGQRVKSHEELGKLLATDDFLVDTEIEFTMQDKNPNVGGFVPGVPHTYEQAAIIAVINKKSGPMKGYYVAMVTDPSANTATVRSMQEIIALSNFRRGIIESIASNETLPSDKKVKVVASVVKVNDGDIKTLLVDGQSVIHEQRNIADVPGFGLPTKDGKVVWSEVSSETIGLHLGKGDRGDRAIMDADQHIVSYVKDESNSGNAFISVTTPVRKDKREIKVNQKQIKRETQEVIDLIYDLVINKAASDAERIYTTHKGKKLDTGVSAFSLLDKLINFGEKTIVQESRTEEERKYLLPKQFYISSDSAARFIVYGEESMTLDQAKTEAGAKIIKDFIVGGMHWNLEKNHLSIEGTPVRVNQLFPQLDYLFNETNLGIDKVEFAKGFTITKEDVNSLTWAAWMLKNGKITTDAIDGIFGSPYLHVESYDVVPKDSVSTPISADGGLRGPGASESAVNNSINDSAQPDKSFVTEPAIELEITPDSYDELPSFDDIMNFDLDGAMKEVNGPVTKEMNSDIESAWLMDKLGLQEDEIDIRDEVIKLAHDRRAMGLMTESSIVLWNRGEAGTAYHEAFHRVSLLLLNQSERNRIYSLARNSNPELTSATEKQIEEYLAELFREQMLSPTHVSDVLGIRKFFRKIANITRRFLGMTPRTINRLFKDIQLGAYSDVKVDKSSLNRFKEAYTEGAEYGIKELKLRNIGTYSELFAIRDSLVYAMFQLNNVAAIGDISDLDMGTLKAWIKKVAADKSNEPRSLLFTEIDERFEDIFKPKINQFLAAMDIKEVDEDNRTDSDSNQIADEAADHSKASYEISKADNTRASVKMFIATMPNSEMVDGKPTVSLEPLTGMPTFVPFVPSWNKMISELSDMSTVPMMIEKIDRLSKVDPFYKLLLGRLNKVDAKTGKMMLTDQFITQFWGSLFSMRHQFINIGYREIAESKDDIRNLFVIRDSDVERATRELPTLWGQSFAENPSLFPTDENGDKSFNKEYAQSIKDRYLTGLLSQTKPSKDKTKQLNLNIEENRNAVLDEIVDLYNMVGIAIDRDTLNYMLQGKKGTASEMVAELTKYLTDTKSGSMSILFNNVMSSLIKNNGELLKSAKNRKSEIRREVKEIFLNEKFAERLAVAQSKSHKSYVEATVIGADGAKLYQVSQNNIISDTVRELNTNPELVNNLINTTYVGGFVNANGVSTGSRVLRQLKDGTSKGIDLKTFVKLTEEGARDKGRDYLSISDAEDYVMKMSALANDYMTIPTMADKKTYMFVSGVELIHQPIVYSRFIKQGVDGKNVADITIDFPSEAKNQLSQYMRAEFMSIKNAWQEFKTGQDLIKVYHYKSNRDGSISHGNGLRFRYFGNISAAVLLGADVINKDISLNSYLDIAEDTGNTQAFDDVLDNIERLMLNDYEVMNSVINASLMNALKKEVAYAGSIGVIEYNGTIGSIKNKLLDRGSISRKSAEMDSLLSSYDPVSGNKISNYGEQAAILDALSENLVNEIISVIEFEKLFSKDPAFYKDTDAKIKRLSSMLSTGTNLRTEWPIGHALQGVTTFTSAEAADNIVGSREYDKVLNRFKANEINELIVAHGKLYVYDLHDLIENHSLPAGSRDQTKEDRLQMLQKSFKEEFVAGSKIAEKNSAGYGLNGIDETDATVYITPKMWRNMQEMLGDWNPDMQEAFDLLESEDQSWVNNDEQYNKVAKLAMAPMKMIYFGSKVDSERGLDIPKLDKMAMFPLFKFMANGDLSHLYDTMNSKTKPIDMVAFQTAVKVGNIEASKIYTDASNTEMADLSNMATDTQEYKYLRKQLVTDAHHQSEMSLGTQPAKAAMSNIIGDRVYQNIVLDGKKGATGNRILEAWRATNVALSDRGVVDMEKELGFVKNADTGVYEFNEQKLIDLFSADAERSKMPDDVVAKLKSNTKENPVSLQALQDWKWIQSRVTSMIGKNVIDIKTPGGMFIQMTAFGLRDDGTSKVKGTGQANYKGSYKINNGNRLRFLNDDGSMDAVVSINLFKDVIPADIKKLSFTKQVDWLMSNGVIGKDSAPSSIGYRVPTQGLSSMSALKIVDVLPANIEDTIILPTEFTKLTGSDFDIDKLYIARYNFKVDREGAMRKIEFMDDSNSTSEDRLKSASYEETRDEIKKIASKHKSDIKEDEFLQALIGAGSDIVLIDKIRVFRSKWIEENREEFMYRNLYMQNSTKALQNRLLDLFMGILTDPSNAHETRMPLDTVTDELKGKGGILEEIDKLSGVSRSTYPFEHVTPAYQSRKKAEYAGGKGGIGPMALANAHHVLTQVAKLEFFDRGPIKKFGMKNLGLVYGKDGKRILDWLSAMINAFVDIAKDPYIIRLNMNPYTYSTAELLLRTGLGKDTFYYLSQPILKDVSAAVLLTKGRYGSLKNVSAYEQEQIAINGVKQGYIDAAIAAARKEGGPVNEKISKLNEIETNLDDFGRKILDNEHIFDHDFLVAQLSGDRNSFEWNYNQVMMMETFDELSPFSKALAELVKYSQVDGKKWGNTLISMSMYNDNVNELIAKGKYGVFRNLPEFYSKTFLGAKLKNAITMSNSIGNSMFFRTTPIMYDFLKKAGALTGSRKLLSAETVESIADATDSLIKSEFFINRANEQGVEIKDLFYGADSMARRLYKIKDKIAKADKNSLYLSLKNNVFINHLKPDIATVRYIDTKDENGNVISNRDEYNQRPDHILTDSANNSDPNYVTMLKEYWAELLDSPIEDVNKFANDFILYQFFSNGENGAINQVKLGEDVRTDIGLEKFIKDRMKDITNGELPFEYNEAVRSIFVNRWYDDNLVPYVKLTENQGLDMQATQITGTRVNKIYNAPQVPSPAITPNGKARPLFFVDDLARPVGIMRGGGNMFSPFVKVSYDNGTSVPDVTLFELVGVVRKGDEGFETTKPVYAAINKSSEKVAGKSVVEFGLEKSIIPANKVMVYGSINKSVFESKDTLLPHIPNLFNRYNEAYQNARLSIEQMDRTYNLFSTFQPVTSFESFEKRDAAAKETTDTVGDLYDKVINYANIAKSTGDFDAYQMLSDIQSDDNGYSESQIAAALHLYSKTLKSLFDTSNKVEGEDGLNSLKTRVEEYADKHMEENKAYSEYFNDYKEIPMSEGWTEDKIALAENSIEAINGGLESMGLPKISQEDYNNMSQEELDKLKACYGI